MSGARPPQLPRLLAIMGSGETAPTMVKTHRSLLSRLSAAIGSSAAAVLLDTPYGFQENADIISARAVEYFSVSVGYTIDVASWRTADDPISVRETALARVGAAAYVFAGPGSPTYALRQWAGTPMPDLLGAKLRDGGCVTFASAAALTLGAVSVPVYEIYKSGGDVEWADGLDLLAAAGLPFAVIPHYDNAEGGNHDTRFCYLGERRLAMLEASLPEDTYVLGVDEHTACIFDFDAGTATVAGNGTVTVRRDGRSTVFPTGTTMSIGALVDAAVAASDGAASTSKVDTAPPAANDGAATAPSAPGLLAAAGEYERAFDAAVANRDVEAAVAAVLGLDAAIVEWSRDTLQSDEPDRARVVFRRMVVGLGELARRGATDPAELLAPVVDAVLRARRAARDAHDFALADELRDRLVATGIEVNDTPDGTTWSYPEGGG
jgi:cyanophycinase-like exopeptidase